MAPVPDTRSGATLAGLDTRLQTPPPPTVESLEEGEELLVWKLLKGQTEETKVLTWGEAAPRSGTLGREEDGGSSEPRLLETLRGLSLTSACAGAGFSLVLTSKGRLFGWGVNNEGQLRPEASPDPALRMPVELPLRDPVRLVACGEAHTLAALSGGGVLAWGRNTFAQLGMDDTKPRSRPEKVPALEGTSVVHLAAGPAHSAAVTANGAVWTWGCGEDGRLGHGTATTRSSPKQLRSGFSEVPIVKVACGVAHTLVLGADGRVYSWGRGMTGALGHGTRDDIHKPTLIEAFADGSAATDGKHVRGTPAVNVKEIAAAVLSMAIASDGTVYVFGECPFTGPTDTTEKTSAWPRPLSRLREVKCSTISCGTSHAAVVTTSGQVLTWGRGGGSILGRPDRATPLPGARGPKGQAPGTSLMVQSLDTVALVACGYEHTVALSLPEKMLISRHAASNPAMGGVLGTATRELWAWYSRAADPAAAAAAASGGSLLGLGRASWLLLGRECGWTSNALTHSILDGIFDQALAATGAEPLLGAERREQRLDAPAFGHALSLVAERSCALEAPGEVEHGMELEWLARERIVPALQARPQKESKGIAALRAVLNPVVMEIFEDSSAFELLHQVFASYAFQADVDKVPDASLLTIGQLELQGKMNADQYEAALDVSDFASLVTELDVVARDLSPEEVAESLSTAFGPYPPRRHTVAFTFPEMLEVLALGACTDLFSVRRPGQVVADEGDDALAKLRLLVDKLEGWVDRTKDPEKYKLRQRTDKELEYEVKRVYGCYCDITTATNEAEIDKTSFRRCMKECKITDNTLLLHSLDLMFQDVVRTMAAAQATSAARATPEEGKKRSNNNGSSNLSTRGASRDAAAAAAAAAAKAAVAAVPKEPALDDVRFRQIIGRIACAKFPDLDDKAAFRKLVEQHMVPAVSASLNKVNVYVDALIDPGVVKLIADYTPQLQRSFRAYMRADTSVNFSATVSWEDVARANSTVSFSEFCKLCQDKKLLPGLVGRQDVEKVFRRANFGEGTDAKKVHDLNFAEFVDALGLLAMLAFSKPQFQREGIVTPTSRLQALFDAIQFRRPVAAAQQVAKVEVVRDPEGEWMALLARHLAGKGENIEDQSRWHWGSSLEFPPCLLREVVVTPLAPEEVASMLLRAGQAHVEARFSEALATYQAAKDRWTILCGTLGLTASGSMHPEHELYFAIAMGAVLQTDGRDAEALALYRQGIAEAEKLPEGHPDVALAYSSLGSAHFHRRELTDAFVCFVKAKVLRDASPMLGSSHVDSAVAAHNLACVLDRLGLQGHANALLSQAHQTLSETLGPNHPRSVTCARNHARIVKRRLRSDIPLRIQRLGMPTKPPKRTELGEVWKAIKPHLRKEPDAFEVPLDASPPKQRFSRTPSPQPRAPTPTGGGAAGKQSSLAFGRHSNSSNGGSRARTPSPAAHQNRLPPVNKSVTGRGTPVQALGGDGASKVAPPGLVIPPGSANSSLRRRTPTPTADSAATPAIQRFAERWERRLLDDEEGVL